ncbi:MAG: phosphatidate cytidylyltransferase [Pseudomonadota bacterium]
MPSETTRGRTRSELALRLASAAVLIPFALCVVYFGGVPLAVGCAVFAGVMGLEWAGMSRSSLRMPLAFACALPSVIAGTVSLEAGALCVLASSGLMGVLAFGSPVRMGEAVFGVLYAGGMPLALFVLRDGPWDGLPAALIFMSIVWASDAAAYFAGKGFGGPRLSPRESPNKTWSGAIGAVISTALCGAIAAYLTGGDRMGWIVTGILISVVAQGGDLFESQIKRRFGVKDAGGILPGHGGIMDRVDGLGAVCAITVLVFIVVPASLDLLGLNT